MDVAPLPPTATSLALACTVDSFWAVPASSVFICCLWAQHSLGEQKQVISHLRSRSNQQGFSGPYGVLPVCGVSGRAQWSGVRGQQPGPAHAARRRLQDERGEPLVRQVLAGRPPVPPFHNLCKLLVFEQWSLLLPAGDWNRWGVWSRVRAFIFRGNSDGPLLGICDEIHVRRTEHFAALMNLSKRRCGRGAIFVILQNGEPVRNGWGIQRQRSATSKKAALEI